MKKLIYGSLFLAIIGIGIVGCKKETINEETSPTSAVESDSVVFDISLEEFQYILNSQNSNLKARHGERNLKNGLIHTQEIHSNTLMDNRLALAMEVADHVLVYVLVED